MPSNKQKSKSKNKSSSSATTDKSKVQTAASQNSKPTSRVNSRNPKNLKTTSKIVSQNTESNHDTPIQKQPVADHANPVFLEGENGKMKTEAMMNSENVGYSNSSPPPMPPTSLVGQVINPNTTIYHHYPNYQTSAAPVQILNSQVQSSQFQSTQTLQSQIQNTHVTQVQHVVQNQNIQNIQNQNIQNQAYLQNQVNLQHQANLQNQLNLEANQANLQNNAPNQVPIQTSVIPTVVASVPNQLGNNSQQNILQQGTFQQTNLHQNITLQQNNNLQPNTTLQQNNASIQLSSNFNNIQIPNNHILNQMTTQQLRDYLSSMSLNQPYYFNPDQNQQNQLNQVISNENGQNDGRNLSFNIATSSSQLTAAQLNANPGLTQPLGHQNIPHNLAHLGQNFNLLSPVRTVASRTTNSSCSSGSHLLSPQRRKIKPKRRTHDEIKGILSNQPNTSIAEAVKNNQNSKLFLKFNNDDAHGIPIPANSVNNGAVMSSGVHVPNYRMQNSTSDNDETVTLDNSSTQGIETGNAQREPFDISQTLDISQNVLQNANLSQNLSNLVNSGQPSNKDPNELLAYQLLQPSIRKLINQEIESGSDEALTSDEKMKMMKLIENPKFLIPLLQELSKKQDQFQSEAAGNLKSDSKSDVKSGSPIKMKSVEKCPGKSSGKSIGKATGVKLLDFSAHKVKKVAESARFSDIKSPNMKSLDFKTKKQPLDKLLKTTNFAAAAASSETTEDLQNSALFNQSSIHNSSNTKTTTQSTFSASFSSKSTAKWSGVLQTVAEEFKTFEAEIAFMQFCEYKTDFNWRTLPHTAFQSDPFSSIVNLNAMKTEADKIASETDKLAGKIGNVKIGDDELEKLKRDLENETPDFCKISGSTKKTEKESKTDDDQKTEEFTQEKIQNDWAEIRSWIGLLYRYGREAQQRCVTQHHIAGDLQRKTERLIMRDAPQFFARICRIAQDHMIALKAAFLRRLTIYRHMIQDYNKMEVEYKKLEENKKKLEASKKQKVGELKKLVGEIATKDGETRFNKKVDQNSELTESFVIVDKNEVVDLTKSGVQTESNTKPNTSKVETLDYSANHPIISNSYLKIQSSEISEALRKLEQNDSGNGEELTQTDRMSILFLKEVFRELDAIMESARCVTFVCSTLDSKFFATYGSDITWELYNLYLFNTVVLGEEGIQAVYKHGLSSMKKPQFSNPSAVANLSSKERAALQNLKSQKGVIKNMQVQLRESTIRWNEVNEIVTKQAMAGVGMMDMFGMDKYGDIDEPKYHAGNFNNGFSNGGLGSNNIGMKPTHLGTRFKMHTLKLTERAEISKQEFYRNFLENPSLEQRREFMGEKERIQSPKVTMPFTHFDDENSWDSKNYFMKNTQTTDYDTDSSILTSTDSEEGRNGPPPARPIYEKAKKMKNKHMVDTIERLYARVEKEKGNCQNPDSHDQASKNQDSHNQDDRSQNDSISSCDSIPDLTVPKINPFERGLLSAEIYSKDSGFNGLFDILKTELQSNIKNVFDDVEDDIEEFDKMEVNESKTDENATKKSPHDENLSFIKNHPVSMHAKIGTFSLTSYPSVTDDWEWDSPIWTASPVFNFENGAKDMNFEEEMDPMNGFDNEFNESFSKGFNHLNERYNHHSSGEEDFQQILKTDFEALKQDFEKDLKYNQDKMHHRKTLGIEKSKQEIRKLNLHNKFAEFMKKSAEQIKLTEGIIDFKFQTQTETAQTQKIHSPKSAAIPKIKTTTQNLLNTADKLLHKTELPKSKLSKINKQQNRYPPGSVSNPDADFDKIYRETKIRELKKKEAEFKNAQLEKEALDQERKIESLKQKIEESKAKLSADALKRYNDYRKSGNGITQQKTTQEYLQKVADEVKAREERQDGYGALERKTT